MFGGQIEGADALKIPKTTFQVAMGQKENPNVDHGWLGLFSLLPKGFFRYPAIFDPQPSDPQLLESPKRHLESPLLESPEVFPFLVTDREVYELRPKWAGFHFLAFPILIYH